MNQLQVVANEILPVYQNENNEKVVNARELHEQLLVSTRFNDWISRLINNYGFTQDEDFYSFVSKTNGRPSTEYLLTIDTAKEIAMVQNNEAGRTIRKYFIEVEKRFRQQHPKSPAELIFMLAQQNVENEKRMAQLQQQVSTVQHRLNSLDTIDTEGDLQQRLNKMIQRLAWSEGVNFQEAWKMFRNAFNTAYRTNLKAKINNYKEKHGLKQLTVPQYLSLTNQLSDAVRVADKLLNKGSATA